MQNAKLGYGGSKPPPYGRNPHYNCRDRRPRRSASSRRGYDVELRFALFSRLGWADRRGRRSLQYEERRNSNGGRRGPLPYRQNFNYNGRGDHWLFATNCGGSKPPPYIPSPSPAVTPLPWGEAIAPPILHFVFCILHLPPPVCREITKKHPFGCFFCDWKAGYLRNNSITGTRVFGLMSGRVKKTLPSSAASPPHAPKL